MRWMVVVLVAGIALAGVVASMAPGTGQAGQEAAPLFVTEMPPGYRDWRVLSGGERPPKESPRRRG
jgi:hypothetical protein